MKLTKLLLTNFRSFEHLELDLGQQITLLLGDNGSGKTSILDSVAVGLGIIPSLISKVKGVSFKKSDLRQQNNTKGPYVRVSLHSTRGIAWDRTERRDKVKSTEKQVPPSPGLVALKSYMQEMVHHEMAVYEYDSNIPVFAYYGVNRALLDVPLSHTSQSTQAL